MMQLDTHPIRSRKAFVGDTYSYSSGSHIYPEDWDCIRQICPPIKTALIGPASASNPPPVFIEGLRSGAAGFVSTSVLTADEDDCVVIDVDASPAELDPVVGVLVAVLVAVEVSDTAVCLMLMYSSFRALSPFCLP